MPLQVATVVLQSLWHGGVRLPHKATRQMLYSLVFDGDSKSDIVLSSNDSLDHKSSILNFVFMNVVILVYITKVDIYTFLKIYHTVFNL